MQIILAFNTDIIVIHNYMLFRHGIGLDNYTHTWGILVCICIIHWLDSYTHICDIF